MSLHVPSPTEIAAEVRHNKACDACRAHKVRCMLLDTSEVHKICQRCARTDRQCIFTPPPKRKPRKRTDMRVAELEREVQAMKALFESNKGISSDKASSFPAAASQSQLQNQVTPEWYCVREDTASQWNGLPKSTISQSPSPWIESPLDIIERGVVSEELAFSLFHSYVSDLAPYAPYVVFPPGTTAAIVRRERPILFLAVVAAASGKSDPSLFSRLSSEVLSSYVHRTTMKFEKSLELVLAIIVHVCWYYPPGNFARLKFYEYIHAASSMAMDLGLGTNPNLKRGRRAGESGVKAAQSPEEISRDLEKRRTFLACYLMTTGVAMSMRRPNTLRFNKWIAECIEVLSTSSSSYYSDKYLCQWARLVVITEEAFTSFSLDDENNIPSLSETHIQFMLKSFEKRLDEWHKELTSESHPLLFLAYHYTQIYMHEIAIHDEHPPEDFRPPYRIGHPFPIENDNKLTQTHISSVVVMISSAHAMIEVFLSLDIDALRSVPMFSFVRLGYACIILTKLYASCRSPGSQIAIVFDTKSLKIGFYLEKLVERLEEAVGPMECRAPYTFLSLIQRIFVWYQAQEGREQFTNATTIGFPEFMVLHPESVHEGTTFSVEQPDADYNTYLASLMENDLKHPPTSTDFLDPSYLFDDLDMLSGDFESWPSGSNLNTQYFPSPGQTQPWI